MTSVFLLRLNKIDEQRTRWADYNDDSLEYHFLNQKTEMHYFQEKKRTLLNRELRDDISLQLTCSEKSMIYRKSICKKKY